MAGPGGREVGRVSIRVLPDTSTFGRSLEAYLERVEKRLRVELPVSLSAPDVARTEAQLAVLARDRTVNLDIDTSAIDRMGKSLGSLGGGTGGGIGFLNPGVILAITGAVGALSVALPGLLAAVAAPLGAIALGFDGIKRSAAGLKVPFEQLRASVSDTFERGLTPSMEKLQGIFPTLTDGFNGIATSLSEMFSGAVSQLTSPEGLGSLSSIFESISGALSTLAPAMGPFVDSILMLAESGAKSFEKFAPLLAKLITDFNSFLEFAERTGILQAAMDALGFAIFAVIGFFGGLVAAVIIALAILKGIVSVVGAVVGAIINFAVSLPGKVKSGISSLVSTIKSVATNAWNAAKDAFTTGVNAVVGFAKGLPGKIKSALSSLVGNLKRIGKDAMNGLWQGLKDGAGRVLAKAAEIAGAVKDKIAGALKIFSPSRVMMQLGEHITEGLRRGIASGQGDLERTMLDTAGIVSGIRTNLDLAGVGGRGGLAAAGGVNLTVNPQPQQSEEEIGRHAANRLLWVSGL